MIDCAELGQVDQDRVGPLLNVDDHEDTEDLGTDLDEPIGRPDRLRRRC
jgi:hypothetical protein